MTVNYAAASPNDRKNNPMPEYPAPIPQKAIYLNATGTSSVITMTDDTTIVEFSAVGGQGGVMRWVKSTDTQASVVSAGAGLNFDHYIPANGSRRLVVPIETQGVSSIVGINKQAGLYNRYAIKAVPSPNSSVFAAEF